MARSLFFSFLSVRIWPVTNSESGLKAAEAAERLLKSKRAGADARLYTASSQGHVFFLRATLAVTQKVLSQSNSSKKPN